MLQDCHIVGVHWYDGAEGSVDPCAPTLAVAYDVGKVQLSRSLDDERPIVLDTQLKITQVGQGQTHASTSADWDAQTRLRNASRSVRVGRFDLCVFRFVCGSANGTRAAASCRWLACRGRWWRAAVR